MKYLVTCDDIYEVTVLLKYLVTICNYTGMHADDEALHGMNLWIKTYNNEGSKLCFFIETDTRTLSFCSESYYSNSSDYIVFDKYTSFKFLVFIMNFDWVDTDSFKYKSTHKLFYSKMIVSKFYEVFGAGTYLLLINKHTDKYKLFYLDKNRMVFEEYFTKEYNLIIRDI